MGLYLYTYLNDITQIRSEALPVRSGAELGFLSLAVLCTSVAVLEIPAGIFSDTVGRKVGLIVAMIARSLFLALLGLATCTQTVAQNAHASTIAVTSMVLLATFVALDSGTLSAWLRTELDSQQSSLSFAAVRARSQWVQTTAMFLGAALSCVSLQLPHRPTHWCYFGGAGFVAAFSVWMVFRMGPGGGGPGGSAPGTRAQRARPLRAALKQIARQPALLAMGAFLASVYAVFYTVDGFWITELAFIDGQPSAERLFPILILFTVGSTVLQVAVDKWLSGPRMASMSANKRFLVRALGVSTALFAFPLLLGFLSPLDPTLAFAGVMLVLTIHKIGDASIETWTDSLQNLCITDDSARATTLSLVSMVRSSLAAILALVAWQHPEALVSTATVWASCALFCLLLYPLVYFTTR